MKNTFYFLILLLIISSCTEDSKVVDSLFAQESKIKISEKEIFFNQKQKDPETNEIPQNIHIKEQEFVSRIANADSGLEWFLRGPRNIGGRTRALALDAQNSNRILVGGVSGGVWISEDLGDSFIKATTPQQFHSVTCIAQDKSAGNNEIWYYGTGEQNGNSSDLVGNGIYKSTDNGLSWTLLASTTNEVSNIVSNLGDFTYVKDIKVNPTNGDIVVAAFSGIWLSQDGGITWTNELVGGADPNGFGYINFGKQTNIDVTSTGIFYATLSSDCADDGIWRSEDGMNWTDITPTGLPNAFRRVESGISEFDEDQVFFIADISTTVPLADNHQLWKYNHNSTGGVWTDKTANIPFGTCTGFYDFDFGYFQSQNSYDLFITVHPSDTNLVFLGGTNLYRSEDGFSTPNYEWVGGYYCDPSDPGNYIFPNHHPDNHAAVFIPNSDIMISAHDGGLSRTDDCKSTNLTWDVINNGYNTSQFYTAAIEHGDTENEMIVGGMQDNGTWLTNTINPQQDWMNTFYGDGAYCAIADGRESYYISWQGGKTFKADIDDDGNVNTIVRIDPTAALNFMFINPFILDPTNTNTMYLSGGSYLWRNDSLNHIPLVHDEFTTNNMGWSRINESNVQGLAIPGAPIPRISNLDMSRNNSNVIYYGTEYGAVYRLEGLDDGSYVKTSIRDNIMPSGAYVSCLEVDNKDENKVFVTFSNYNVKSIFYSEDAGENWTDVSGNLEEFENGSGAGPSVNWINAHDGIFGKVYIAGTTSGLFSTDLLDGTNTVWVREGVETIGNVPIHMITSREFDNNVVVATHGNGIYSNKEFANSVNDLGTENLGFYLSNPYPNPVKDKMKFSFRLDKTSNVQLKIIDMMGSEIFVFENQNKLAGTYEKRWFVPKNTAKGIYNLVLEVDGKKLNKQFLLK